MPDAITMLKADHKAVKGLFTKFERLRGGSDDERRELVQQIVRELSIHAVVEEQAFYPAVRKALPDVEDVVLEGLEEHHIVKWTCSELDGMAPTEERYDAKVRVLIESVRHHIEEEEGELFPQVRSALGRKALQELGETMEQVKQTAPGKPRPKAPDEPPAGKVPDVRAPGQQASGGGPASGGSGSSRGRNGTRGNGSGGSGAAGAGSTGPTGPKAASAKSGGGLLRRRKKT